MRYQHRMVIVTLHDKHARGSNPGKRRRGSTPDRYLAIFDTDHEDVVEMNDEDGDDREAFERRVRFKFVDDYLNELGDDGWKVVSYTASPARGSSSYPLDDIPAGVYMLVREKSGFPDVDDSSTPKA